MDWIPALLKYLDQSRTLMFAVFITALGFYGGPKILPAYIDPVSKEWTVVALGTLLFSGAILATWALSWIYSALAKSLKRTASALRARNLTDEEELLLCGMAKNPHETLNLNRINYEQVTRLDILAIVHGLERKGMISRNPINNDLFTMSPTGIERAIKIHLNSKDDAF